MNTKTTIRTSEDPSVRFAKLFAKLYYHMGAKMIECLGEERGKAAIAEAVDAFGRDRVAGMKEEAAERGLPPMSKATYDAVREMPGIGWEFKPEGVTKCPLFDIWKDYGEEGLELAKIYCEIDHVLLNSFGIELERNFVLSHGHDYCQFIYKEGGSAKG